VGVVGVDNGMTLASSDQPAIERQCEREGDDQADSKAPPEERVAEARVDRAGDEQDERVVDISITEIDAVSDANATESARRNGTPARSTGPIVSE